jgi:predicted ATPase
MHACKCPGPHTPLRVVLTGGPGAGKTAILEFVRMAFCRHVRILPEAAGILFGGGFPRSASPAKLRSVQRAIFQVQRELEASVADDDLAIILCDRGTVDGAAYWPGPESFWDEMRTTEAAELERYHAVIHLRTPSDELGYDFSNPLRVESPQEAARIDDRIAALWSSHPRWIEIPAMDDFLAKARRAMDPLRALVPPCCRDAISPTLTP